MVSDLGHRALHQHPNFLQTPVCENPLARQAYVLISWMLNFAFNLSLDSPTFMGRENKAMPESQKATVGKSRLAAAI